MAVRSEIADRVEAFAGMPSLRDFTQPLHVLSQAEAHEVAGSVDQFAQRLGQADETLAVRVEITDASAWLLSAGTHGCEVTAASDETADLEIILDADSWRELVSGDMSPLEIFGRGRVRVRGEIGDARRFVRLARR